MVARVSKDCMAEAGLLSLSIVILAAGGHFHSETSQEFAGRGGFCFLNLIVSLACLVIY